MGHRAELSKVSGFFLRGTRVVYGGLKHWIPAKAEIQKPRQALKDIQKEHISLESL
jgi:hypothetical protein